MDLPLEAWVVIVLIIAAATMGMLRALAVCVKDVATMKEFHDACASLRRSHEERLRLMAEQAAAMPIPDDLVEGEFEMVEPGKKAA